MFSLNIHFQGPSVFHDVTVTSQVRVGHKICAFSPCIYYFRFASEKWHKINKTSQAVIELASFAVFLSIFCFDDVIALINIS